MRHAEQAWCSLQKLSQAFLELLKKDVIAAAASAVAAPLLDGAWVAQNPLWVLHSMKWIRHLQRPNQMAVGEWPKKCWFENLECIFMCPHYFINVIDNTMRDLAQTHHLFAGKVVLFSGESLQELPVIKARSRAQIVSFSFRPSPLHSYFQTSWFSENTWLAALLMVSNWHPRAFQTQFTLDLDRARCSRYEEDCATLPPPNSLRSDVFQFW